MTSDDIQRLPPPRCLGELVTRPGNDPGVERDSLVESWPERFFVLACPCGGAAFAVRSHICRERYLGFERVYGPITLRCAACGRAALCFDPALNGYDVEIDHFPEPGPYSGDVREFGCPSCAGKSFALTVCLQYPDGVIKPQRAPGAREPASQDLFSYFTLIGACTSCAALATISSVECL